MFLHDSDHSYRWRMFEYTTVRDRLKSDGILLSDDVDVSYAFIDFMQIT